MQRREANTVATRIISFIRSNVSQVRKHYPNQMIDDDQMIDDAYQKAIPYIGLDN